MEISNKIIVVGANAYKGVLCFGSPGTHAHCIEPTISLDVVKLVELQTERFKIWDRFQQRISEAPTNFLINPKIIPKSVVLDIHILNTTKKQCKGRKKKKRRKSSKFKK